MRNIILFGMGKKLLLFVLITFILNTSVLNAVPDPNLGNLQGATNPAGTVNLYDSIMKDVMPLTIILLMISAGIYALGFMASKFLNNDKLRKRVEVEIYQAFATAVILFLAVSLFTVFVNISDIFMLELIRLQGLDDIYNILTTSSGGTNELTFEEILNGDRPLFNDDSKELGERLLTSDSHMKYARVFLLNQLNKLDSFYSEIFIVNSVFHSTFNMVFAAGSKYLGGFFNTYAMRQSIFGYLFYGFFFTYLQLALLDLIKMFFYFMFPWGIFLRSFSLTNSVGSVMIAMSIGIYFIYPTILGVLLITNHDTLQLEEDDIIKIMVNEEPSEFIDYLILNKMNYESVKTSKELSKVDYSSMTPEEINAHMKKQIETGMLLDSTKYSKYNYNTTNDLVMNFVQRILLNMYLFPLVALAVTYTFIHNFAGIMQANVSEMGRGLIRLI